MSTASMPRADFVAGLVFFVLGVYMVYEGLQLPGAGGFIEAGGEPGRVPIMLGAVIAGFALILLIRAVAQGGHRLRAGPALSRDARIGAVRCMLTALVCAIYALGLLGATIAGWQVRYHEATALFLFAFITGFEWHEAPALGARRWAWLQAKAPGLAAGLARALGVMTARSASRLWLLVTALLQAVLVTWVVTYVFESQFYVRLP
ncbi:MAG: hypothetical protein QNJ94_19790 [Alphaproteobacteria bacterium]|nr:hypothetical protein [Alphaproteobacteria bacterium]